MFIIVFLLGSDGPWRLFFSCPIYFLPKKRELKLLLFTYFQTNASLLTFFILFHSSCSDARVFGKTLVHEFPINYTHTEWHFDRATTSEQETFETK